MVLNGFNSGARVLAVGLMIVFSIARLARLIVAFAFSLVGVIGFGLQGIARRIVHPADQRLLPLRFLRLETSRELREDKALTK